VSVSSVEEYLSGYGGNRWGFDGWELHCGDCFQVLDSGNNTWLDVRIEMADDWYLVGLPPQLRQRQLSSFKARRYP
jgi:hypothetical protein